MYVDADHFYIENPSVTSGQIYTVYWDDSTNSTPVYGASLEVSLYMNDGLTSYFQYEDYGMDTPWIFTASANGSLYLALIQDAEGAGDFALRVTSP